MSRVLLAVTHPLFLLTDRPYRSERIDRIAGRLNTPLVYFRLGLFRKVNAR